MAIARFLRPLPIRVYGFMVKVSPHHVTFHNAFLRRCIERKLLCLSFTKELEKSKKATGLTKSTYVSGALRVLGWIRWNHVENLVALKSICRCNHLPPRCPPTMWRNRKPFGETLSQNS